MGIIPPNEKEFDMPRVDENLLATMEELLNKHIYTYYVLDKAEKQNIRNAFLLGFRFAKIGYKSRIKKSKVTEKWIIEQAENTAADYPDVAFPNLIKIFKSLFKEAGWEVVK